MLKFSEFQVFLPSFSFMGDRSNSFLVCQNDYKVFLLTIRQLFYPGRHTLWKFQSTTKEGEFVLRKFSISQDLVISSI